jgi:hypothetical protein
VRYTASDAPWGDGRCRIDDYLPSRSVFVLVRRSSPLTHKPCYVVITVGLM